MMMYFSPNLLSEGLGLRLRCRVGCLGEGVMPLYWVCNKKQEPLYCGHLGDLVKYRGVLISGVSF